MLSCPIRSAIANTVNPILINNDTWECLKSCTRIRFTPDTFALEDMYGLKVQNVDGQPHLCLDASISAPGSSADEMLRAWMEQADKLENGEISKEEYDEWRYKYPELDTYQKRAKIPSQELSDYLVK